MTAPVAIDIAMCDRHLLGAALGDTSTWVVWLAILKAAHGCRLNENERKLFAAVAGNREPPTRKVKELVCVASRRSGKGRVGAALCIHAALLTDHSARCLHQAKLALWRVCRPRERKLRSYSTIARAISKRRRYCVARCAM